MFGAPAEAEATFEALEQLAAAVLLAVDADLVAAVLGSRDPTPPARVTRRHRSHSATLLARLPIPAVHRPLSPARLSRKEECTSDGPAGAHDSRRGALGARIPNCGETW